MLLSNGELLLNSRDAKNYLGEKIGYNNVDAVLNMLLEDGEFISQEEYDMTIQAYNKDIKEKEFDIDYYSNMLSDTKEEVESIINYIQQAKRLNKQKVIEDLQQIYNNIHKNT